MNIKLQKKLKEIINYYIFNQKKILTNNDSNDGSVGFYNTTNCVLNENMHIRSLFIVQLALDDTLCHKKT